MAFIDKLLEGGLPYGMEIEQPKAHDEINRLVMDNDVQSIVQGLVMGTMGGGGGGKGLRELVLAMKGKIKGGKMIPSQPFRKGTVGHIDDVDASFDIVKDSPLFKEQSKIFHQQPKVKKAMDDFINARGRFKRGIPENVETGKIDDILESLQQSERYVNYRPSFFQSLIDKFKKTF